MAATQNTPLVLANTARERPNRYRADLIVYGIRIGHVERGWTMGGRGAKTYIAQVEGITVAEAHTLSDLREYLREWITEERQMQSDARHHHEARRPARRAGADRG